jgi:hypothetical protein
MTLNLLDRSNYLRGTILLNKKYEEISSKRYSMIEELGGILGFNKKFIDNSLNNFTDNKFVSKEPPKFSNVVFAEAFLRDSIKIALADNDLQLEELQWLWKVASFNSLSKQWFYWELEDYLDHPDKVSKSSYEVLKYIFDKK